MFGGQVKLLSYFKHSASCKPCKIPIGGLQNSDRWPLAPREIIVLTSSNMRKDPKSILDYEYGSMMIFNCLAIEYKGCLWFCNIPTRIVIKDE